MWISPITFGEGPGPRYQHSMTYQLALGFLIIFGGKDETNQESKKTANLHILNLSNLNWLRVETGGVSPSVRSMHTGWNFGKRKSFIFFFNKKR